jgi:predicted SprT family Zn-dependent metalloprotease
MKIISEDILKLLNNIEIQRSKQLIFENVYFSEIFNHLITYCFAKVLTEKIIKLSGSDIKNKLNPHWKYFNEFNINKSLIISSNFDLIKQFINLTELELSDIKTRLKNSNGIFCSDFVNDKNTGLIIIDEKINSISKFEDILIHELIHCLPYCNNHGSEFKKYANIINEKLGYNITRVGNKKQDFEISNIEYIEKEEYKYKIECEKCGKIFHRKRLAKNFIKKYRCNNCLGKLKVEERG